jgi:hypothetical protein
LASLPIRNLDNPLSMPATRELIREYTGSCHCGRVHFCFRGPAISGGCRCNCSICTNKGALMSSSYVAPDDLIKLEGTGFLTKYQFGDHLVNHYFCRVCGIHPFHEAVDNPGHYRINLGCVKGVDLDSLDIVWIDGRSF